MKPKIYPLLLVFYVLSLSQGKTQNSTLFQEDMDDMFQVNRSYVSTGLLKDYGLLLTDVAKFNGIIQSNNMADRRAWQLLYSSIYFMKFNSNITLASPEVVNAAIANDTSRIIKLIGLHYNYQQFKTNAATSNLVYVQNNKIYDQPNRPTTPYEIKNAFCMVPHENVLRGATQKFIFKPELFYTNVNKPPVLVNGELVSGKTLKVDFGDGGGYRTVLENIPLTITYTTEGLKTVSFKITYADGTVMQSKGQVIVSGVANGTSCPTCRSLSVNPDPDLALSLPQTGFAYPTTASMDKGEAFVYYGGTDHKLDKPLIIVEGFDPNNKTSYKEMFDPYFLGYTLTIDGVHQELSNHIKQAGYDIVFLNLADGGGDIRRNGRLLENLMQWVNKQKALNNSTEKNIVIGVSMGGLIARYGLRDMELNGINHDTKLYGSFDSPHLGANVPLGLQAAVRVLAGAKVSGISFSALADFSPAVKSINSIAAQQMLIYQWEGLGTGISVNNTPHLTFQNELNTMGLPQMWGIRKIAIASGSECAVNQGYEPYFNLITINNSKDIGYLANWFLWVLVAMQDPPVEAIFKGMGAMMGNLFVTDSDLLMSGYVRALPDKEAKSVFNLKIEYRKVVLWGLAQRTRTLFSSSKSSTADMLPLDNNSGGSINPKKLAGGSLPSGGGLIPDDLIFSFIPTASALYLGSGSQALTTADLTKSYSAAFPPTGQKNIPFDNFFSNPVINAFHAQVTEKNGKWLLKEFQGTPEIFSCSYQCANSDIQPIITGNDLICSGNYVYKATFITPGTTLSWSNNPGVSYVSGQGTNSYTIQSATSSGPSNIALNISGECQTKQLNKSIWVGRPFIDGTYNGGQLLGFVPFAPPPPDNGYMYYNPVCTGPYADISIVPKGSASGSLQRVTSNPYINLEINGNTGNFYFWADNQTLQVKYTTSNACGTSGNYYYFKSVKCVGEENPCNQPQPPQPPSYSISPNPSHGRVRVVAPHVLPPCETNVQMARQSGTETNSMEIQSINLYDLQGQLRHSETFRSRKESAEFDVSALPNGVYILKIVSDGNRSETHRIIVNNNK